MRDTLRCYDEERKKKEAQHPIGFKPSNFRLVGRHSTTVPNPLFNLFLVFSAHNWAIADTLEYLATMSSVQWLLFLFLLFDFISKQIAVFEPRLLGKKV